MCFFFLKGGAKSSFNISTLSRFYSLPYFLLFGSNSNSTLLHSPFSLTLLTNQTMRAMNICMFANKESHVCCHIRRLPYRYYGFLLMELFVFVKSVYSKHLNLGQLYQSIMMFKGFFQKLCLRAVTFAEFLWSNLDVPQASASHVVIL